MSKKPKKTKKKKEKKQSFIFLAGELHTGYTPIGPFASVDEAFEACGEWEGMVMEIIPPVIM